MKERIAERERSLDANVSDTRRPKAADQMNHKNSDSCEYNGKGSGGGVSAQTHRSSDPSAEEYQRSMDKAAINQHRLSDPASVLRDKRLSADSDIFRGSYEPSSLQRRPGSVRSTSSSSLDGHRISDPELKKMQHIAVLNFFEMKTGKRLSSSSMDSSGNSKYNSLSSRGRSSIDSAVGLYRERSPSPHKMPDDCLHYNQEHPLSAMTKSKSLPRDIAGHAEDGSAPLTLSLAPSLADPPPAAPGGRPMSAREPAKDRRRSAPSGPRWAQHKKEKSAPSQMESYQVAPLDNVISVDKSHQAPLQSDGRTVTADVRVRKHYFI